MLKNLLYIQIFSFCKFRMHANIRRNAQIRPDHFRYFRPFIPRCGISRTSLDRMSNFSTRPLMRSSDHGSDIHSFCRYLDAWGRERRRWAERAGEESDNLFSRVSRRCCSYAASFFVYHIRIGEAFFLAAGPWDQTGFHRRGAVTENTSIPKPSHREVVRFGPERRTFPRSICRRRIHFVLTQRHAFRGSLS